ncbi:protein FAR1-RELATED SEQUENCE 5-like [Lolium perenne]|uniref:protein FAR1-RELATED SEQUENCE 5-like n=1 Tax=Lolium perenne TaxID=4522 RepID=UPI003A9A489D
MKRRCINYNRYAKKLGFSIKCSTSKNSTVDGQKDKQMFVCNKNGKNEDINMQEAAPVRQRNKSITKKTECKARLRIKRKAKKWHVTYFIEEHNHSLVKKFSLKKYLRSHKGIPKEERDFVKLLHKVNLSAGRVMRIRGEVYGGLANVDRIFWVDGPAIAAYKNYIVCLSFDTTYLTNMYNMPFAPFIGINRWHIMQNAQAVLGNFLSKHEELRQELNAIIDYSMSVDEFETRWADMLRKHSVADNTHLADLYHLRATFVPAYFKDRFFPFLQTTTRSEGFNAVLKTYSNPHYSLHHFFEQYLKLQEKINVAEDSVEFLDEDKTFRVWGDYPLEEQALKRKKKKQAAPSFDEAPDVENVGDDGQGNSSKFDHVEDPVYIAKQGRPAEKRKKSGLHLKATKVVKCSEYLL